ncbi:MAG: M15 family peptidase, partial [Clostridia bacterium]|nr:M15 family peptidase [Clostridia bacterium]
CFPKCNSDCISIVDGLKAVKANSGFAYRKKIAELNGITEYRGTADQNIEMLNLFKQGKLMKP